MSPADEGVLLVDWENLAGAILGRDRLVERAQVDDLWSFANRRCGEKLHHAHLAAAKFDPSIAIAMRDHMIEGEQVRSTKEQADILLTVLAMDYLHQGIGHFFLATGDQDFIPLISRLRRDGRKVTVVYGDRNRLSRELRQVLKSPGLESVDIEDISTLRPIPTDTGCRPLLGMLELLRRGYILGGKEDGERTGLLNEWGIIETNDETRYWALVGSITEKVSRIDAAVRQRDAWVPRPATRTYLKLSTAMVADIVAIDHAVRAISARPRGLSISALRTGPFRTDTGVLLDRVIDALSAAQIIHKEADGTFSLGGPPLKLGYLEQLWRVFAGVTAECHRRQAAALPFNQVQSLLARRGIGQAPDQRAVGRIKQSLQYAKAAGVVDTIAIDAHRYMIAPVSRLSQSFEQAYYELYGALGDKLETDLDENEILTLMEERDESRTQPHFGFELRDRQRFLRILAQSQLATWQDKRITFVKSAWGEAGRGLQR